LLFITLLDVLLALILVALVSGNNLSVSTGPIISGRVVNKRTGVLITILGYVSGFLLQGSILRKGISSLLPAGSLLIPVILVISIIMFIIAHKKRVPESLSIIFISALIGVSLAYGSINTIYVAEILSFWIVAGIVSLVLASVVLHRVQKLMYRDNVWTGIHWVRILLIIISFLTAFTLGANTLGTIASVIQPSLYVYVAIIVSIVLGSVLLSTGELHRLGDEIMPMRYANALVSQLVAAASVELATLLSVPLSNTQMLTSTIYGTGLGYKERLLSKKPAVQIVSIWIITAVFSVAVAYAASAVILAL
jgi:PiT family inorganic phosphate transporter